MDTEEAGGAYSWTKEYEKTWEAVEEGVDGTLQSTLNMLGYHAKRRKLLEKPVNIKLGMMRHLFLIIDMSKSMQAQDLKPTRLQSSCKLLEYFVDEYFDQNPISQMGIIVTKNKKAEKISELGGNPKRHIKILQSLKSKDCDGEPSIYNSLDLASQVLKHMPSHGSREILIIFSSISTCDPHGISSVIEVLQMNNIRVSVVGLSAEVFICKKICKMTVGKYNVVMDETHFKDILTQHLSPPAATVNSESSLIRMGFPHHQISKTSNQEMVSQCMCHLGSKTTKKGLSMTGYFCPNCKSKYCELPIECKICGLTLVSAPHLARSYHHLFPLPRFTEILASQNTLSNCCYSCQKKIIEKNVYKCEVCWKLFCIDCDLFIHEVLHTCPGCASSRQTQQNNCIILS